MIRLIFLLPLLYFLMNYSTIAFAENYSSIFVYGSADLELVSQEKNAISKQRYEEECEEYINYFESLGIFKIYQNSRDYLKKQTSNEINFINIYSRKKTGCKLNGRLKFKNLRPYPEVVFTGSWFQCSFKIRPIGKFKTNFQFDIYF